MISPESDFATFSYFLQNPGDLGDQYSQFTKDANSLIISIISTNYLPESIQDNTDQFINEDVPKSVNSILNLTDLSDRLKDDLIEYLSTVLLLITWGISHYNSTLYSVLFEILDRNKPFYKKESANYRTVAYITDEEVYNKIFDNLQVYGFKDCILNSFNFDNNDEQIKLTNVQIIEWFNLFFKLVTVTKDYEIQQFIDIFAQYIDTNKNKFTKFNDFETIKTCFNELHEYLYHLPHEQNDVDFHISKLFDFALWCIEDSEAGLYSQRYSVAVDFFANIIHSFHSCTTDCFYIFSGEHDLLQKLLSKGYKNSLLNEIIEIACALAEKEDADLVTPESVLNIYNSYTSSGNISTTKDHFLKLLTYCKISIVDEFASYLLQKYTDDRIELLVSILCRARSNKQNEIIDFLLQNVDKPEVKNQLKNISDFYIDETIKQLLFDKYFDLYLKNPQSEELSSIFSFMIKFCVGDVVHQMISLMDLNRKVILKEIRDHIRSYDFEFTKEDMLAISKVVDDDLFDFLHFILKKFDFNLFSQDSLAIVDQIAHGNFHPSDQCNQNVTRDIKLDAQSNEGDQENTETAPNDQENIKSNNTNNDICFNLKEDQLTIPFVQFLGAYLKRKQKKGQSNNRILFEGYKDVFNFIMIAKNPDIVKLLMHLFIKLSAQASSDYDSLQALYSLIKESIGIKDDNNKNSEANNKNKEKEADNENSNNEHTDENNEHENNENANNDNNQSSANDNEKEENANNNNEPADNDNNANNNNSEPTINDNEHVDENINFDINSIDDTIMDIVIDDDKYCRIVKLAKKFIEFNESSFVDVERHNKNNKTIKIKVFGCGLDEYMTFPEYITLNEIEKYLKNIFEPGSKIKLETDDVYINSSVYQYRLTERNYVKIVSDPEKCKLKAKIPIPLSILLDKAHYQRLLYKKLNADNQYVQKQSYKLLQFLPDDPLISILNQSEWEYIKKNFDAYFYYNATNEQNDEYAKIAKNVVNRLNSTQFSSQQIEYQIEILRTYINFNKAFRKQLKKNEISTPLFYYFNKYPDHTSILNAIYEIKLTQVSESILHSLLVSLEYNRDKKNIQYTINRQIQLLLDKNKEDFTSAFNCDSNINYVEHLLSLNEDDIYSLIKKKIVPNLTNLVPLFNMLMNDIDKVYENPSFKKILLKIIPLVRPHIDYNSIFQDKIMKEQPKHPKSHITLELIAAFKPTENLSLIMDSIDKLLFETTDEEMQKAIFELLSSYRSSEIEEKLIPYFSIKIDRWNYDSSHEQKSDTGFCGLRNLGATCYFNSILQILFFTKPFCEVVLKQDKENIELRKLFSNLTLSNQKSVDPSSLTAVWKGWDSKPIDPREQQDAFEFFQMFLDKLPSEYNDYFKGKFVNIYKGFNLSEDEMEKFGTLENFEDFFAVQLVIKGFKNLNESIEHFISPDILNEENQLYREELSKKVDAEKITRIEKAPPFLVIQLKRFEYNYQTHIRDKIMSPFSFESSIVINRLMKNNDPNGDLYYYHLYGIVLHSGTADSGHYSALVRVGKKWFTFNDSEVEFYCDDEVFDNKIETDFFRSVEQYEPLPYLLFYERIKDQSELNNTIKNNNNNNNSENEEKSILTDLAKFVCNEDKQEIEQTNSDFARIQWLFGHECFDFITKSVSHKLRFTYLFHVLGHSKNFCKFQSDFFDSFSKKQTKSISTTPYYDYGFYGHKLSDNTDDQKEEEIKLEEFDNEWFLNFLIENTEEFQEIIIHATKIDEIFSFIHSKLITMPIDQIFPYFNSFAKNLSKVAQLWRKVLVFTSPMSDFISISDDAKAKAKDNGWLHISTSFIEDFYANNPNKVPIEGINLTNIFEVIGAILQNRKEDQITADEKEDINIIKTRYNVILQSKDHLEAFYDLIINTYPLIIDSPHSFILSCEDDKIRNKFFQNIFTQDEFIKVFTSNISRVISMTNEQNISNNNNEQVTDQFLLILINYAISKVNGDDKPKRGCRTVYNYQIGAYERIDENNQDNEFIQLLISNFDQIILPLVFISPYCYNIAKLISDMFYNVKPKSSIIKDYESNNNLSYNSINNYYYTQKGTDLRMIDILDSMITYAKSKLKEESNSEIKNKDDVVKNENMNENNNENNDNSIANDSYNICFGTFLQLTKWIISRNELYNDKYLKELLEIKDLAKGKISNADMMFLISFIMKFPPKPDNCNHILSVISDLGIIDGKIDLNDDDEEIFQNILKFGSNLYTDEQVVQVYGPEWFIQWVTKAWQNKRTSNSVSHKKSITKIISTLAHHCQPSLNLIIDYINNYDVDQPVMFLLNTYIEVTLDLLPFETINHVVNYTVKMTGSSIFRTTPNKNLKMLESTSKLIERVNILEIEENKRRQQIRLSRELNPTNQENQKSNITENINNTDNNNSNDIKISANDNNANSNEAINDAGNNNNYNTNQLSDDEEVSNEYDDVHYLFKLELKNIEKKFSSIIDLISISSFRKSIKDFIKLLIPRLHEKERNLFIAQFSNRHNHFVLLILADLGELKKMKDIIVKNVDCIDEDYADIFDLIAEEAFKEIVKEKRSIKQKQNQASRESQNENKESNENENKQSNENENKQSNEKENKESNEDENKQSNENDNKQSNENDNKQSNENENQVSNENENKQSNENQVLNENEDESSISIDNFIVQVLLNVSEIVPDVFEYLVRKRHINGDTPTSGGEDVYIIKNIETVVDALVSRISKYSLRPTIKLIAKMIQHIPQTKLMFRNKLADMKDTIKTNCRNKYGMIFSSSSSSSSSSDDDENYNIRARW